MDSSVPDLIARITIEDEQFEDEDGNDNADAVEDFGGDVEYYADDEVGEGEGLLAVHALGGEAIRQATLRRLCLLVVKLCARRAAHLATRATESGRDVARQEAGLL